MDESRRRSLTSFGPLTPEPRTRTVGFFRKFFAKDAWDEEKEPEMERFRSSTPPPRLVVPTKSKEERKSKSGSKLFLATATKEISATKRKKSESLRTIPPKRTLQTVLSRIGKIMDTQGSKEDDLRQYWMNDESCKSCYDCGGLFTTFRRRHHCRVCGQIFCSRCCWETVPLHWAYGEKDLRVCNYCATIVKDCRQRGEQHQSKPSLPDKSASSAASSTTVAAVTPAASRELKLAGGSAEGSKVGSSPGRAAAASPHSRTAAGSSVDMGMLSPVRLSPGRRASLSSMYQKGGADSDLASFANQAQLKQSALKFGASALRPAREPSFDLYDIWRQIEQPDTGLIQSHRHRLRTYPNTLIASEAVDWLVANNKANNRSHAGLIGQALLDSKRIEHINGDVIFKDEYALYKLGVMGTIESEEKQAKDEKTNRNQDDETVPEWFRGIPTVLEDEFERASEKGSPHSKEKRSGRLRRLSLGIEGDEDAPIGERRRQESGSLSYRQSPTSFLTDPEQRYLFTSLHAGQLSEFLFPIGESLSLNDGRKSVSTPTGDDEVEIAVDRLQVAHNRHLECVLRQQMRIVGVDEVWLETILRLAREVSLNVLPDHRQGDEMDVRKYMKIKKVPGDSRTASQYVSGVVFTKTLINKKMKSSLRRPKILLLRCALEYERVENKFSSIDTLVLQERSHTKTLVARIRKLNPQIVVVEKTASQVAREMLHRFGIALVVKVKPTVMYRLSRCTGATLVTAIDQLQFNATSLGTCDFFQLVTYRLPSGREKTLMSFEGCPPERGCTLIIRGASRQKLEKVKKVLGFAALAAYNLRQEMHFLVDMQAVPPPFDRTVYRHVEALLNTPRRRRCRGDDERVLCPLVDDDSADVAAVENSSLVRDILASTFFVASGVDSAVDGGPPTVDELLQERDGFLHRFVQVLLSTSPFVVFPLPYLETVKGRTCNVRRFLSKSIYWSESFCTEPNDAVDSEAMGSDVDDDEDVWVEPDWGEPHPFTTSVLSNLIASPTNAAALADYRARGGRVGCRRRRRRRSPGSVQRPSDDVGGLKLKCNGNDDLSSPASEVDGGVLSVKRAAPYEPPRNQRTTKQPNKVDCLNPANHQQVHVLFSSQSSLSGNAPNPCISPWIVRMKFYGRNDISLGAFLQRYCFRRPYPCAVDNCNVDMVKHVRHFVHGRAVVRLQLQELQDQATSDENDVACWTLCKRCKQTFMSPNPLSPEAQAFSFVKYLELRFYGRQYRRLGPCTHSLNQDHIHGFVSGNIVATFEHSTIVLLEVVIPAIQVTLNTHGYESFDWMEEVKTVHSSFIDLHKGVEERLVDMTENSRLIEEIQEQLKLHKRSLQIEQEEVLKNVDKVKQMVEERKMISSTNEESTVTDYSEVVEVVDAVNQLKRACVDRLNFWNRSFNEIHSTMQRHRRTPKVSKVAAYREADSPQTPPSRPPPESTVGNDAPSERFAESVEMQSSEISDDLVVVRRRASASVSYKRQTSESDRASDVPVAGATLEASMETNRKDNTIEKGKPRRMGSTFFSRLLPEAPFQAIQSPFPLTEHYTLPLCRNLTVAVYDKEPSSVIAYALSTKEYGEQLKLIQGQEAASLAAEVASVGSGTNEKQRSRGVSPSLDEIAASFRELHYAPSPTALESGSTTPCGPTKEKEGFIQSFLNLFRSSDDNGGADADAMRMPSLSRETTPERSFNDAKAKEDVASLKGDEPDGGLKSPQVGPSGVGVKEHATVDYNSESYKFYCQVFFAEKFRKLREITFPAGEERYARSLSRCRLWSAKGGKSGSKFCKTFDDRLIIKQMSAPEQQSFMKFAPRYFDFVIHAHTNNKPTVIAKVLGVYRIVFRNNVTNTSLKQDVLVMENLFYGRKIARIFDLKGSERNRYVQTTNQSDVLMDTNLLEFVVESPLFIRPHAKSVLKKCIVTDTEFLSKQLVMDYSLLVGIDESRSELVVGIIDFIRTFTWDKRLEMWVKSSGILGGHGKMPTVVSPDVYRKRFCEAMERYFLEVPDKWSGLGAVDMDDESAAAAAAAAAKQREAESN